MENNETQIQDDLQPQQLPSMLNVLTILTYIACAFTSISSVYQYFTVCKRVDMMNVKEMPELGGTLGKFMEQAVEMANKQCDKRLVVLVATLATTLLCFMGAMMMRQLKKQGFMVYLIGELIGPAAMLVILGSNVFAGLMMVGLVIPLIMIVLYATQRKFLIN